MISVTLDLNPVNIVSNAAMGVGRAFASSAAVQRNLQILAADMGTKIHPEIARHAKHGSLGHLFEMNSGSYVDAKNQVYQNDPQKKAYAITIKVSPPSGGASGASSGTLTISAKTAPDRGGGMMPIYSKIQDQAEKKEIELKRHVYPNSADYLESTRNASRVVGSGKYRVSEGNVKKTSRVIVPSQNPKGYILRKSAPWRNPHHGKFAEFLAKYMTAYMASRKGDMQLSFVPGPRRVSNAVRSTEQQFRSRGVIPRGAPGFHVVDGRTLYTGYRRIRSVESYAQNRMMKEVNEKTAAFFAKYTPQVKL